MKIPHLWAEIEFVEAAVKKWRSEGGMDVDSPASKSFRVADVAIISMPACIHLQCQTVVRLNLCT